MQMTDFSFGQGDDLHAREGHALEQAGDVFLIAGKAIHRFGEHELEATACGIGHEGLDTGPQQGRSRDGMVGIVFDHKPALLFGVEMTQAQLICDRGFALVVGRIAGIDRNTHYAVFPVLRSVALSAPAVVPQTIPELPCGQVNGPVPPGVGRDQPPAGSGPAPAVMARKDPPRPVDEYQPSSLCSGGVARKSSSRSGQMLMKSMNLSQFENKAGSALRG
ncbi:hypothetical protein HK28_12875 [Acetobacter sp. DsW_063]|nr:hypothetical protein HK28_12875 [Acetobacter sp. DsW_063]